MNTKQTTLALAVLLPVRTVRAAISCPCRNGVTHAQHGLDSGTILFQGLPMRYISLATPKNTAGLLSSLLLFSALLLVAHRPASAEQVLLVSNLGGNTVGEYNADTGATIDSTFINTSQGLSGPAEMALDGNNHLFVANINNNTVGEYKATTGATINPTFINGQGLSSPAGLAFDRNNHLLVANYQATTPGVYTVGQYDATTGVTVNANFISPPGAFPDALAIDTANRIFVGTAQYDSVAAYDATTGAQGLFFHTGGASGGTVGGIVVDALNHVLVADTYHNVVHECDATTGAIINATFISDSQGLNGPYGLTLDGNNHLFVVNNGNNTVGEYDATTGATINATFISGSQGLNVPLGIVLVNTVPEPSTLVLAAFGFAGLAAWGCRRNTVRVAIA